MKNIENIIKTVADDFTVSPTDLLSLSRRKSFTLPRHVAMYLAWKLTGQSTLSLGESFNRDHTMILYADKTIRGMMAMDREFEDRMVRLEKTIKGTLKPKPFRTVVPEYTKPVLVVFHHGDYRYQNILTRDTTGRI